MTAKIRDAPLRVRKRSKPQKIPSKSTQLDMLEELRQLERQHRGRAEEGSKDFDRMSRLKKDLGIDPF